jgi:predicted ABC-type ATPase
MAKDIVILGGPNGAGKTTAARVLMPDKVGITEFVNADEIARGLSPFDAERAALAAGRIMLERMSDLRRRGQSFAFETTCSGRTHVRFLEHCRMDGWRVNLLFLWLPSPAAAIARVERRVREGGHAIPREVIARRYRAGMINMRRLYLPLADVAAIYDNSDEGRVLVAERTPGSELAVHDSVRWAKIESASL